MYKDLGSESVLWQASAVLSREQIHICLIKALNLALVVLSTPHQIQEKSWSCRIGYIHKSLGFSIDLKFICCFVDTRYLTYCSSWLDGINSTMEMMCEFHINSYALNLQKYGFSHLLPLSATTFNMQILESPHLLCTSKDCMCWIQALTLPLHNLTFRLNTWAFALSCFSYFLGTVPFPVHNLQQPCCFKAIWAAHASWTQCWGIATSMVNVRRQGLVEDEELTYRNVFVNLIWKAKDKVLWGRKFWCHIDIQAIRRTRFASLFLGKISQTQISPWDSDSFTAVFYIKTLLLTYIMHFSMHKFLYKEPYLPTNDAQDSFRYYSYPLLIGMGTCYLLQLCGTFFK